MSIHSFEIKKGVNLHHINTDKFKTATLGFYFHRPLSKREVTINALLSHALKRGCPSYPDTMQLNKRLDELYGASLSCGVRKKGDSQVIHINFEFISENYVKTNQSILDGIFGLAKEIITGQTHFAAQQVQQEKENLRRLILSVINDKRSYANIRCVEIMCQNEPHGIRELGFAEDIEKIDEKSLYEHYKKIVLKSPVDVFVCGDVDINKVLEHIKQMFEYTNQMDFDRPKFQMTKSGGEIKKIIETENIAQGKLSLGFTTGINAPQRQYPALLIFNALYGGGPSSKLFNNVREKLSLAYYASSRADLLKGIMTVNSGIEVANYQKAYDEIMLQLGEIQKGNVTDEEMSAAVLAMINSVKSITDSAIAMEDYWLGRLIADTQVDFDELTSQLGKVTIEDVVEVSRNVALDTVYFLKGKES
ncbi:MAG: insulinase family protein [Firmicutes bacterium]|nr:insulinase family protein [Bacillota bacterium]